MNPSRYNSKALSILGGIIEKVAGMSLDQYLDQHFFEPMKITNVHWIKDEAGRPNAAGGLFIEAPDLIKIGQLILDKGYYQGHQFINNEFIDLMLAQGQPFDKGSGLLWWRYFDNDSLEPFGYYASGFLGQYLFIIPSDRLVAVRLVDKLNQPDRNLATYEDFLEDLARIDY